jgi:hypothetical protein
MRCPSRSEDRYNLDEPGHSFSHMAAGSARVVSPVTRSNQFQAIPSALHLSSACGCRHFFLVVVEHVQAAVAATVCILLSAVDFTLFLCFSLIHSWSNGARQACTAAGTWGIYVCFSGGKTEVLNRQAQRQGGQQDLEMGAVHTPDRITSSTVINGASGNGTDAMAGFYNEVPFLPSSQSYLNLTKNCLLNLSFHDSNNLYLWV